PDVVNKPHTPSRPGPGPPSSPWRCWRRIAIQHLASRIKQLHSNDAIRVLLHSRVHRLPVIDPLNWQRAVHCHSQAGAEIHLPVRPPAAHAPAAGWTKPIIQLGIGTHSNIAYAGPLRYSESPCRCFCAENRVSALPVLSSDGRLTDIYSKFDVINLAATKTYNNLDISVAEALQYRRERFEGVSKCSSDATLKAVIDQLVQDEVHRLWTKTIESPGMVSLSDVLNALVRDYERLADHCSQPGVARETLETGLLSDTNANASPDTLLATNG
uniref:Protein kinase domain-containing protein n=1 Tax=Macrostomum lignano TaxID=282301 RepID=A0A1I8FJE7_9PLAT